MRKQKQGRRFVQRVKVQRLEGIGMSLPDEVRPPTATRQPMSVARLRCPLCGSTRYIDQTYFDFLAEAKRVIVEGLKGTEHEGIAEQTEMLPRHTPCKAIMHLEMLADE